MPAVASVYPAETGDRTTGAVIEGSRAFHARACTAPRSIVHRANFYFDAPLREALARTRTLSALQTILRESVPAQLSADLWVRSLSDGTLYLGASNGGAAAKVKQMLPRLVQRFSQHGFELKAIRVNVDRKSRRRIQRPSHKPQVDADARRHLAKLVAALGDSPLKRAVEKLITPQSENGKEPVQSEE